MISQLSIELIARAVIIHEQSLLLCQAAGKGHYYLPGGHVEFGETAEVALTRELQEEIAVAPLSSHYIGAVEHIYTGSDNDQHHEVNLLFTVELPTADVTSQEDHIKFIWQPLEKLSEVKILPAHLTTAIKQWISDNQPFWQPATLT